MSDFKAKMHQIQFLLGLCSAPDPAGIAYSTPPDSLALFKGPISKGREAKRRGGGGRDLAHTKFLVWCLLYKVLAHLSKSNSRTFKDHTKDI